jgi:elongation factor Tu
VYLLTAAQGGRRTALTSGERTQFYFRTSDVDGRLTLTPADGRTLHPGTRLTVEVDLDQPVALERGLRFALRNGGRTIGMGAVVALG